MINKEEILEYIKNKNFWYEITEHGEVHDMSELSGMEMPYPDLVAKNLFLIK